MIFLTFNFKKINYLEIQAFIINQKLKKLTNKQMICMIKTKYQIIINQYLIKYTRNQTWRKKKHLK